MFCRFCGGTVPNDSTFCQLCGKSLAGGGSPNVSATPALPPMVNPPTLGTGRTYPRTFAAAAVAILLVVGLIWWTSTKSSSSTTLAGFRQASTPVVPQFRRFTIGTGALTVKASGYSYYTLTVPSGATNVRLQGRFTASGGFGNDIEVYLLSDTEYVNWQNGHSTPTLYNSGKVTVGDVNAVLPNAAAVYYLIFNNQFSLFTPKAVEQNISLTYYQ